MDRLALLLLVNHLKDIISDLEEHMEIVWQKYPEERLFTRMQKSMLENDHTFKEILPLYGVVQALQESSSGGVDTSTDSEV
mgnify:CR=1 FL=1